MKSVKEHLTSKEKFFKRVKEYKKLDIYIVWFWFSLSLFLLSFGVIKKSWTLIIIGGILLGWWLLPVKEKNNEK